MNTGEQILNFFKNKTAVKTATADDIINLEQFCKKLDELTIEKYVNSLSIKDISELDRLKRLIWECSKQILDDLDEYEEELEVPPEVLACIDVGDLDELEDEHKFWTSELSKLRQIKSTVGHLETPYRYISADGVVEETLDIDAAIKEVSREADESDINIDSGQSMLSPGTVSYAVKEFVLKRNIALNIINLYKKMESTVFKATRIQFDAIAGPLAECISGFELFDKPIDKDSLLGLLNLSEDYKAYKIRHGKNVYVYALIRKISDKMSGFIASPGVLAQWSSKAYSYFALETYHKTHKDDYLSRNTKHGGVNKFDEKLDEVFEDILTSKL